MNLNRKVATSVDELDQKRELCAGPGIDFLSEQGSFVFLSKLCDGLARKSTFRNYGLIALYA